MMDNFYQLDIKLSGKVNFVKKKTRDYLAALQKVVYTVFDVPIMNLN
jgi:hypothetical protein